MRNRFRFEESRIAQVIRAHRKKLNLSQQDLARELGVRQYEISRIESGKYSVPISLWMHLCDTWQLPYNSFKYGFIDLNNPIILRNDRSVGKFKIPPRYRVNQGSTVRILRVFRNYAIATLGEKAVDWYFQQRGLDPDYFVHLDNQLGVQFSLDFISFLREKTDLENNLDQLTNWVSTPAPHGVLAQTAFEQKAKDAISSIQTLIENITRYEVNFDYQIESQCENQIIVSGKRRSHLKNLINLCDEANLGDFLCRYRMSFLSAVSRYGTKSKSPLKLNHPKKNCEFHGADRCVYFASTN